MENKINKAMELINLQKETIADKKNKILVAETRREENAKSLEEDKKKVEALGYDPEKIDEVVSNMEKEIAGLDKNLNSIIEELESFDEI